jgi:hypothetical protein
VRKRGLLSVDSYFNTSDQRAHNHRDQKLEY